MCARANPRLEVRRARFSALVHADIARAVHNLVPPREADALAVDARQEIDLRIGASFTRFQTLLLQVWCLGHCQGLGLQGFGSDICRVEGEGSGVWPAACAAG